MATIKGKWLFNESPTIETTLSQEVNFTSDGKTYYKIVCKPHNDIDNIPCIRYYRENLINYDDAFDWDTWTDGKQTVDFGDTEQEVSDEFYTWLTANATQVQEETKPTEYTLRIDGIEVTDYENIIVNGVSYKCKKGASIPTDLTCYTVTVPSGWTVTSGYGRFSLIGYANFSGDTSINNMQGFGVGVNKSWFDSSTNCAITTNFSSPNNTNTYSRNNSNNILLTITGGSDVTNQNLIQWFVDNGATFTKLELITFTIDGTSYQAEEGMTWEQWVNSSYNTGGYRLSTNTIVNSSGSGITDSSNVAVYYTDVIVANATYKLLTSGGA